MIEVRVEGLAELKDLLQRKLPEHIQTKVLQSTLAKAAQPIVRDARGRVPVDTGLTRKSIKSFRSRKSTKVKAVRYISVRPATAYVSAGSARPKFSGYWRFIEFGHAAIKPTAGRKSLGTPAVGFFGKEVPAAPARPFMRPAFEARKYEALERFRVVMADEIQKAATRFRARTLTRLRKQVIGI